MSVSYGHSAPIFYCQIRLGAVSFGHCRQHFKKVLQCVLYCHMLQVT